jgi:hypothetical protein
VASTVPLDTAENLMTSRDVLAHVTPLLLCAVGVISFCYAHHRVARLAAAATMVLIPAIILVPTIAMTDIDFPAILTYPGLRLSFHYAMLAVWIILVPLAFLTTVIGLRRELAGRRAASDSTPAEPPTPERWVPYDWAGLETTPSTPESSDGDGD